MLVGLITIFDRLIGTSVVTRSDGILLRRRYAALQRQQPWLYAILLANLLGLHVALSEDKSVPLEPTVVMTVIIVIRAIRWFRDRRGHRQLAHVQREMRKTFVIAALFNLAFACWTCWLFLNVGASHLNEIVLFAGLAAVGCTYAMTGFPGGARIPLLVLLIPLEAMLVLTREPSKIGIAFSIMIVSGVTLRLLNVHDDAFVKLVRSYVQIGAERKRAVEAEQIAVEERAHVQILANRDVLTGLMNRRGFLYSLEQLNSLERRRLALVLIDLDGFKPINDTFGHPSGDAILIEVSRRLQALGLRGNAVSRLGGDEFALLCQCDDAREACDVASRAVATLGVLYAVDGRTLTISASAGVSFEGDDSPTDAMRRADLALYESKRIGRGQVTLFTSELEYGLRRRRLIEQALREPASTVILKSCSSPFSNSTAWSFKPLRPLHAGATLRWDGFRRPSSSRSPNRSALSKALARYCSVPLSRQRMTGRTLSSFRSTFRPSSFARQVQQIEHLPFSMNNVSIRAACRSR
jgi:diguanylate cyclase (GGDEF)-like protein